MPSRSSTSLSRSTRISDYMRAYARQARADPPQAILQAPNIGVRMSTITLRMNDLDTISFETVPENYPENKDEHIRLGPNPIYCDGRYLAFIRIADPEPVAYKDGEPQHVTSLHVMLSDRNIFRVKDPIKLDRGIIENPRERVYHAILGTVLSHCDSRHLVASRRRPQLNGTSSQTTHCDDDVEKFVFNRHELWKMFQAINPPLPVGRDSLVGLKVYSLRSYSAAETQELLRSAYARGRTFSIYELSEARRRVSRAKAVQLARYRFDDPDQIDTEVRTDLFWS